MNGHFDTNVFIFLADMPYCKFFFFVPHRELEKRISNLLAK